MSNPKKPSHVIVNRDDEVVTVLNAMTGHMMVTNATGEFILSLCDGEHERTQIADELFRQFQGATRAEAEADVDEFLDEAFRKGVVQ